MVFLVDYLRGHPNRKTTDGVVSEVCTRLDFEVPNGAMMLEHGRSSLVSCWQQTYREKSDNIPFSRCKQESGVLYTSGTGKHCWSGQTES